MNIFGKKSALEQLESVRDELAVAFVHHDWERIAELDQVCRNYVEKAALSSTTDKNVLRAILTQLFQLYASIIEACQERRDAARDELVSMRRSTKGAKVYQLYG
ncbi:protein FliT [Pseudomonas duriflava]|uniref:Flagellar protein FliT n=1 Tax=Pseudomonas duriflava TaxID=459528 RepID=A0A562PRQ4_9PSED|nr:flagellar protein FliT [Pseudomonas duriflava]TWI47043.1 protein FliT [Pseudomonas duriflava]